MSTAFALAVLLGLIGTVIGIVALPFKATRRWSRRTVTMSALSLPLFFGLFIWASNREAEIAGFESLVDRQRAKDAGYTEADKWKARGDSDHDELHQVQSVINNVTFSTVEVYVPNPWGDSPPTRSKTLAKDLLR